MNKSEDMTVSEPGKPQLVDPAGQPLPQKKSVLERLRSISFRSWAVVVGIVGVLGVVGSAISNADKIWGVLVSEDAGEVAVEETEPIETNAIKVTKVRAIIDQPASIREFGDTGAITLTWEVVLSNNGDDAASILDHNVLQLSEAGPISYTGLRQGLFTLKNHQLEPVQLPLTISAGHSTAFFVQLGVLMDKNAYSLVKVEFDEADSMTVSAIIDFLRSQESDLFGNPFRPRGNGAHSLPPTEDIREPAFRVAFTTSRGFESTATLSWYKYGLFSQLFASPQTVPLGH